MLNISSAPSKFSALRNVYFGKLCRKGHDHGGGSYRHRRNGTCVECQSERIRAWHATPDGRASLARAKARRRPAAAKTDQAYRQKNKASIAAYNARYIAKNRDWYLSYYRTYNAAKKAAMRRATPAWADIDAIAAVYIQAHEVSVATGVEHDVDHIVPLVSKEVCGLHVASNLRVIEAIENARKGNRSWPDKP